MNTPRTILVVGTDHHIVDLLRTVLEASGYVASTTPSGCIAGKQIRPSLVIVDLDSVDGASIARLRAQELEVPMLILTAEDNAKALARDLGARGWLRKPFDIDVLLREVERLLS